MTHNLILVEGPQQLPLDLSVVKNHLRIFQTHEDEIVYGLIDAVTSYLDARHGILGRALVSQVWDLKLPSFPGAGRALKLPFPPLQDVLSISIENGSGQTVIMPAPDYIFEPGEYQGSVRPVSGKAWPSDLSGADYPVTVRFRCGYGDTPDDVPPAIRQAMLMIISRLYMCREGDEMRRSVLRSCDALLSPWRVGEMAI